MVACRAEGAQLAPQAIIWPFSLPNPYAPRTLELGREGGFRVHFFGSFRAGRRPSENKLRIRLFKLLFSQGSAGASILCKFVRAGEQGREPRRVRVHFGVAREAVRVHFF